jgi:hypothetical protein
MRLHRVSWDSFSFSLIDAQFSQRFSEVLLLKVTRITSCGILFSDAVLPEEEFCRKDVSVSQIFVQYFRLYNVDQ